MFLFLQKMFGLIFPSPKGNRNSRLRNSEFKHQRNIDKSQKRLDKLTQVGLSGGIAAQLNYLRKVDAFVFEEMILSAIEKKSHVVIRNAKYTGDGGVDGTFILNGKKIFIQAKRYSGYVKASDVLVFSILCRSMNATGIFVHTGKTGSEAKSAAGKNVEIVSGAKLISLLLPVKKDTDK